MGSSHDLITSEYVRAYALLNFGNQFYIENVSGEISGSN